MIASLIRFLDDVNTINHLNMKLFIFVGIMQVFKIGISKVQDFGNFELSPMNMSSAASFRWRFKFDYCMLVSCKTPLKLIWRRI